MNLPSGRMRWKLSLDPSSQNNIVKKNNAVVSSVERVCERDSARASGRENENE